jgi:hypothetical protein
MLSRVTDASSGDDARSSVRYGLILGLMCFGLAPLVFSAIFTPVPIGSAAGSEAVIVGP